jgi:hypothetical protein
MTNRILLLSVLLIACDKEPKTVPLETGTPPEEPQPPTDPAPKDIVVTNNCPMDVWLNSQPNAGQPELPDGIVKLAAKTGSHGYTMPATGWAGRFWPKTGCDATGNACATGQALPPCPATGCQPPADTKVEFFFGPDGGTDRPFYDVSLVDGYSLGAKIVPSTSGGRCTPTSCALDLTQCPTTEIQSIGNLQITNATGAVVQCFSPCKKWGWPLPLGDGETESDPTGQAMCCPSPVTPEACNAGAVTTTQYVTQVHQDCPSAYAFSYDDKGGSHDCDPGTTFQVTLCPDVPAAG